MFQNKEISILNVIIFIDYELQYFVQKYLGRMKHFHETFICVSSYE